MSPGHRPAGPLRTPYEALKHAALDNLGSRNTSSLIIDLVSICFEYLQTECTVVTLNSRVTDKRYFSFASKANPSILSRPVNESLFESDRAAIEKLWNRWKDGRKLALDLLSRLAYTMTIVYCAASDLFDRNNKKGPSTYFEWFVGHLFARAFGSNPTKKANFVVEGKTIRMTMDFLFNLGTGRSKVHLPVKMSTRERVVQAWAHQRLLDVFFGENQYRGILVVFSETKLDLQTREVVEICVPDQWLAYQILLARMHRIYYFDAPQRYLELAATFPVIRLKNFAEFFAEKEEVLA